MFERWRSARGPAERQDLDPTSPWWGIHVARYHFALPRVHGALLDIACGTGFGLRIMGERATASWGVDLDEEAVLASHQVLGEGRVLRGDGCRLPFPDGVFDIVTSFETLEHVPERPRFVSELRRVLKTPGHLILSTPNARYTDPVEGKPRNPFHLHEYEPEELRQELLRCFAQVELRGQVLDPRFTISPLWEEQEKMPRTPGNVARRLAWRVLNRTAPAVRNRVSYALWGHPLLPGEHDYLFLPEAIDTAPVLVAVCTTGKG